MRRFARFDRSKVTILAVVTLVLALLALTTPLTRVEYPSSRVGWLLALAAVIEALHALRRSSATARRHATVGALISVTIALFLINAPFFASRALQAIVIGWFAIDAARYAVGFFRAETEVARRNEGLAALGNAGVVLLALLAQGWAVTWLVAVVGALRIAGIAWNITTAEVYTATEAGDTVVSELGLAHEPAAVAIASQVETAEIARAPIDRGWAIAFIATLFAIHMGRMRTEMTLLGIISPGVAVVGDMAIAVLVTLVVVNPLYLLWRAPTRWIERGVWRRYLARIGSGRTGPVAKALEMWLRWRLRYAVRMRAARYSIRAALTQALQTGLPFAAIVAATVPVWGMSWYFDTENWAAGIWNSWAESRTDVWREAMARAVVAGSGQPAGATTFAVVPPGTGADFSFVVIGDPGEGDASQHVLRDRLLAVANGPDVRFVVVSSDVVYPTGSMNDYEAKFWLPFKGVTRPVYAIPGNHDWYDALEAFCAVFLEPDAARAAIRARAEADLRVTSTTEDRIEMLVGDADRLRRAYAVQTGFQRAPFFEIQTERFALLGIDTGILRTIDPAQAEWLQAALERSAGKLTMAIIGHPFFAGGHDTTVGDDDFAHLKQLLVGRGVTIVMAGDTHDLEYYTQAGASKVHHVVNGGGGAYLSFGTALAWPSSPPTTEWAFYPNNEAVTQKIQAETPWWKRPAWWWTRQFGAWPFTAEWLSAAFDYNVAPFFQSFVEVKVEPSAGQGAAHPPRRERPAHLA
jgi:uncharacterized membrane protein HdeD (DUF308 family)